jgi:hypothetical protein
MSWQAIINFANLRLAQYGGVLVHDSTGIGNVISDYLTHPKKLTKDFTMVGAARVEQFNDYIAAIEARSFKGPMIDYAYSEHKYVTMEDLFTNKGHAPDTFVADSLAWMGRGMRRGITAPKAVERDGASPNAA